MDMYRERRLDAPKYKNYVATARRLLDGLVVYRQELGDVGRQLELLLRCRGVTASSDLVCSARVH